MSEQEKNTSFAEMQKRTNTIRYAATRLDRYRFEKITRISSMCATAAVLGSSIAYSTGNSTLGEVFALATLAGILKSALSAQNTIKTFEENYVPTPKAEKEAVIDYEKRQSWSNAPAVA